jgi:hypothetical protein
VGAVIRFRCVTTCNEFGWRESGERMARSFLRNWPAEASLTVYAEDFCPSVPDLAVRRLPAWLDEFKARHAKNEAANGRVNALYTYRQDAVKFAHKVAALTDFGLCLDDGVLIWLDADTFTHSPVTAQWLDGLFPQPSYIAWLDRLGNHPECGMVMYRPGHRAHRTFMQRLAWTYYSDEVLGYKETHDSFILQELVDDAVRHREIEPPVSLSGEAKGWHHPFVAGPLGACMDHCKGARKHTGRSHRSDLKQPRIEPYWAC